MSVTYRIKKENTDYSHYNRVPCFSGQYGNLETYSELELFVNKDWLKGSVNYPPDNYGAPKAILTLDDFKEYIRLLNVMGLKCEIKNEEVDNQIVLYVDFRKNNLIANKIILNSLRYLCEGNFQNIVKWFLKFSKEKVIGVNLYTKFIIAHNWGRLSNINHAFIPYYSFAKPLNNEEFKKALLDNNSKSTVLSVIPACKESFNEDDGYCRRDELTIMFKEGVLFKDIYKKYVELCARYL